jgi:hypothetical protein
MVAPDEVTDPRDAVIVANNRFKDDRVEDLSFGSTLAPGETEVVAEVVSTPNKTFDVYGSAIATTAHAGDIDGDGNQESVVEYRIETKKRSADAYSSLPGLSTTLPFGELGNPVELVPGSYIGPVAGFRIVMKNRSDEFANPISIDSDNIAGEIHARLER